MKRESLGNCLRVRNAVSACCCFPGVMGEKEQTQQSEGVQQTGGVQSTVHLEDISRRHSGKEAQGVEDSETGASTDDLLVRWPQAMNVFDSTSGAAVVSSEACIFGLRSDIDALPSLSADGAL